MSSIAGEFTVAGTWVGRRVAVSWHEDTLLGDRGLVEAVRGCGDPADPYAIALAVASLLDDNEAFRMTGDVPSFDEAVVERVLAGRSSRSS